MTVTDARLQAPGGERTTAYADLEVGLHRWSFDSYAVQLRFSQPGSDADVQLAQTGIPLDLEGLRRLGREADTAAYGKLLGESLFGDEAIRTAFSNARALDIPLRLRLFIGPSAPELHSLLWETLPDPGDAAGGASLLTNQRILFSRYLSSQDWRRVRLRPKGDLRALVAIANPTGLDQYQLAPIDVPAELERAKLGLGTIPVTELASGGSATLANLAEHLRQGYDILYLICHGALIKGEPQLWLEDETGGVARIAGRELVVRLRELEHQPRLIVLASCESAGGGATGRGEDGDALSALGPLLAEVGIPAVLAMQGNITMQTAAAFMPKFFVELQASGQIDRAMAFARGAVRDRPDAWMPVLFMRLKSGRIWYVPGFGGDRRGFEGAPTRWPALLGAIRQGRCTPIIGLGLAETVVGSRRDLAQRWAETYHFPMAPHDREDLPQVAQFLAVNQAHMFPRDELVEYVRQEMLRRYPDALPDALQHASLDELIATVGARRREADPAEPHRVLAELPFPLYVTTSPDNLLAEALRAAGKEPQVELCRWRDDVLWPDSVYAVEPDYRPTPERPLVYHLFGRIDELDSLVLTEDDYFDYLIGTTHNNDLIPPVVRRALAATALFFIGFQMDDWNFRVLFRSIMSREGGERRKKYSHVAVQVDPEEGRMLETEGARRYLETYFDDADISLYWGSAEDFMKELHQQVQPQGVRP